MAFLAFLIILGIHFGPPGEKIGELVSHGDSWAMGGFRLVMEVPSGKRLHSYGKPPFLIGKSTNSMAIFHSYVKVPEGTPIAGWFREWITL